MGRNGMRPAPRHMGSGLGDRFSQTASTVFEDITPTIEIQSHAARWLAQRAGVSMPAAAAIAAANGWGRT